jgi:hypothetical protein
MPTESNVESLLSKTNMIKNRPHVKIVLALMLLVVSSQGYSQYHTMPMKINTPYGPRTIDGPRIYQAPMHFYSNGPYSQRYTFTIVLSNDSLFSASAKIDLKENKNKLKVKSKGKKMELYPADTKTISRITSTGKAIIGIPADTCWLFKITEGKINVYSFLAEFDNAYAIAIQEGNDGEIVKLNEENVKYMVTGHENAMALAEKKRLLKAIQEFNKSE